MFSQGHGFLRCAPVPILQNGLFGTRSPPRVSTDRSFRHQCRGQNNVQTGDMHKHTVNKVTYMLREVPAGLRFRQLTHEISSLIGPSPTYFATQHYQTRSAAPWAGQLRVSVFLLASCLLQSCSIVVSTLATCTPISSDRRHQSCVHCELRAMEQSQSSI